MVAKVEIWSDDATAFYMCQGARIRWVRKLRRLSQAQIAKLIGCHREALSRIENGKQRVTPYQLARLAEVLQVAAQSMMPVAGQGGWT